MKVVVEFHLDREDQAPVIPEWYEFYVPELYEEFKKFLIEYGLVLSTMTVKEVTEL